MNSDQTIVTTEQQIQAAIELCGAKKTAVFDGDEISLWLEYPNDDLKEIAWPKDWPQRVTADFLESRGYEIQYA